MCNGQQAKLYLGAVECLPSRNMHLSPKFLHSPNTLFSLSLTASATYCIPEGNTKKIIFFFLNMENLEDFV